MRRLKYVVVSCTAAAIVASAALVSVPAGAQNTGSKKTLYVVGGYETKGESTQAIPNFDDGAKLAVEALKKQGWNVNYERTPGVGTTAATTEQAFLAAQAKRPDVWLGLTSSPTFIAVGPKVAASGQPTFTLASPSEGVKTGPAGGDNVFLLRPLNEQTYSKLLEFACKTLKAKRIGLSLVNTQFGPTAGTVIKREIPNYKGCEVVTEQTNALSATDLTQQVLAFKNANVDAIIAANYPNPSGVLANQARQNGITAPILGGASLNIAKDAGSVQSLDGLYVVDDCVPDIDKDPKARKFSKAYQKAYGYAPNYASAEVYDAFFMAANAVEKAGHDPAKIVKALAGTQYDGVCDYANDKNNVMAQSVTIYKYNKDGSKKLVKTIPLPFVPNEELVVATTVPPTTVAR